MITDRQNRPLKVLIADDDQDDWYFADLAFKEAGLEHDVHFVKDGEDLMAFLHKQLSDGIDQLPDLILLDLNMPKKDGRVALQEIRENPNFAKLNVVIFSTCISEEDKTFTAKLGATRHVTKPFEFSELMSTIKEICTTCVPA